MQHKFQFFSVFLSTAMMLQAAAFANPSQSQLNEFAETAGSTAADFKTCGSASKSRVIKNNFKRVAMRCTDYDEDAEDEALSHFDLGFANRLNQISQNGAFCKGQTIQRYELTLRTIKRAGDSCR